MADQQPATKWHRLFGHLLRELLTPVGLTVQTELPISTDPPEIDVLIIRRDSATWTAEQLALLPDGIRDSQASHILIEFKYTESFNQQAIRQLLGYETFYRDTQKRVHNLPESAVQSFLVVAKTPRKASLTQYGYRPTAQAGLYHSDNALLSEMPLLVLNQLNNEAYNSYFKLFASRRKAKRDALLALRSRWQRLTAEMQDYFQTLLVHLFVPKGDDDVLELTPEQIVEGRQLFKDFFLPTMSLEERLADLSSADISPEELAKIPFIHQIEEQKLEQGLERGLERGEHRATIRFLKQTIAIRFQGDFDKYEQLLTSLPLNSLKDLSETALTVDNLADFETALLDLEQKGQAGDE